MKLRIAAAFDGPLHQSILRMGTRAVVKFDFKDGIRPDPREVIASSPLDGLVVQVLLQPTITNYHFAKKGAKDDTGGRPFRTGASGLTYEWLGKRDKNLWNWIHVTSPPNPTAEDVAQLNLVGNGNEDSEQAYRIAANPPYFGIPIETAQLVPAAVEHAPDSIKKKLGTGPGPRAADPSALGKSVVSDDAALDDAPKPQKSDLPIDRAIDRTHAQLAFMDAKLGPWKLAGELRGATAFVQRRRDEFVADRKRADRYAAAMTAQERILQAASSELAAFLATIESKQIGPDHAASIGPVVEVLRAYAHAAGVSHLHDAGQAALAEARESRRLRAARTPALARYERHSGRPPITRAVPRRAR